MWDLHRYQGLSNVIVRRPKANEAISRQASLTFVHLADKA